MSLACTLPTVLKNSKSQMSTDNYVTTYNLHQSKI